MKILSAAHRDFTAGAGAGSNAWPPAPNLAECRVLVVYEDDDSRARAGVLCQQLQRKVGDQVLLDVSWWRFRYFEEPDVAAIAARYARAAHVVIFSSSSAGFFPPPVMRWVDSWIARREIDHGAIVPLVDSPFLNPQIFITRQIYLRYVASRAGMDYLNPSDFSEAVARTRHKALSQKYPSGSPQRSASSPLHAS